MTRVTAVLAVVLLPLVWPVGVVLLWMSRVWTTGAKLAGTFLLPGGLALAPVLDLGDRSSCALDSASGCVVGPTYSMLHPASPQFNHVFGALVFAAAAVLPLAIAVHLAMILRRRWAEL